MFAVGLDLNGCAAKSVMLWSVRWRRGVPCQQGGGGGLRALTAPARRYAMLRALLNTVKRETVNKTEIN